MADSADPAIDARAGLSIKPDRKVDNLAPSGSFCQSDVEYPSDLLMNFIPNYFSRKSSSSLIELTPGHCLLIG